MLSYLCEATNKIKLLEQMYSYKWHWHYTKKESAHVRWNSYDDYSAPSYMKIIQIKSFKCTTLTPFGQPLVLPAKKRMQ